MRDRLIELLRQAEFAYLDFSKMYSCEKSLTDFTADYLLENGVIVPPVQMGQEFYHIEEFKHNFLPDSYPTEKVVCTSKVENIFIRNFGNEFGDNRQSFCFADIGKTVFLTKEEAEQALKGGEE